MKSIYQQITSNIQNLMIFNRLNMSQLAAKSGVSASGVSYMLSSGKFRLENLIKIADALTVPAFILLADKLEPLREASEVGETVTINYHFTETTKFSVLNDGTKLTTIFLMKGNNFGVDESKYQEMEEKVFVMEETIDRMKEKIALLEEINKVHKEHAEFLKSHIDETKRIKDS